MASPQWRSYQPPVVDPAILAFQRSPSQNNAMPTTASSPPATSPYRTNNTATTVMSPTNNHINNSPRETGIIEKLLHSYGFVQCCERDARLFFHYSEYTGNIDTLKIGDCVEFQMSYDRKTRKPIACHLVLLEAGSVSIEVMSEEKVTGTVAQEPKLIKPRNSLSNQSDGLGRVSYEQKGECFFLPFSMEDVEEGTRVKNGDQVTFHIVTDKRNGNIRARRIRLLQSAKQDRHEGVVCSMKDSFGFIERSDVVREIFFHYSEYQGNINELLLGDDVQFSVTNRNGKEVGSNIEKLPEGTVIFEDVALERRRGRVEKTLKAPHGRRQSDPLAGRIVYETVNGPIEIPYGDKDQKGDYTLQPADLVEFNIATDRRDKLQRATNIIIVEDTFKINSEKRESGLIAAVKDGFGFLTCTERETRMFFHFSEMMDPEHDIKQGEEVEFTIVADPTAPSRQIAIRIKYLPKGTINFDTIHPVRVIGTIEKEPAAHKSQGKSKDANPGIIMYDVNGTKQTIPYGAKVVQGLGTPKYGDKVEFQICESRRNNTKTAANVKLLTRNQTNKQEGFIATLKDNFGFIETAEHDREVFFHFSAFDGDPNELDLGDEVEYSLARKTSKISAENIRKLTKGTVSPEEVFPEVYDGKVMRCMRIINPDQEEYPGLVQMTSVEEYGDGAPAETYTYGITSLADKRDFLQKGDVVKFQLCKTKGNTKKRATNIAAVRKYVRARVDSIKGQFGFLTHEVDDGKKLFFHMTEVHNDAELQPGDNVEFVVVQNQRNGKYSAVSLRKVKEEKRKRPERLISRLKSIGDDSSPKVIVIRQPKGPDGTKGFLQSRVPWTRQTTGAPVEAVC